MTDQVKILQDISLLYELSLSIGNSYDPAENCSSFLRSLTSRKSLTFGSIWFYRDEASTPERVCDLFYTHPPFRQAKKSVPCNPYIQEKLREKPYFSVPSYSPHYQALVHEAKVAEGSYAIFSLQKLGYLKLFASNRPDGFDEIEMAQLKQVVDKLRVALEGCFARIELQKETEQRLIIQKAREDSEQKLRRIIDSSLDAVLSSDAEGITLEWNAQAEKMLGYTRQEVMGLRIRDLLIPVRHRQKFQQAFDAYVKASVGSVTIHRYEIKAVRKDGSEFLAELSVSADQTDKKGFFVGFVRDIEEQRRAKKEIEQARNQMETLISNLQTGILLENSHRQVALVNQFFCDIFEFGVPANSLIGKDCCQAAESVKHLFIDPANFIHEIKRIVEARELVENQILLLADGRVIERDFIPIWIEDRYEGNLWQYRDVTGRINTEQAIRESEEKYRGILENMELGLLEVDTKGNILRTNNSFCQLLGYRPEEIMGKSAWELLIPDTSKSVLVERRLKGKMDFPSVYEIQMQHKNGNLVWGLVSSAPVKDAEGEIVGYLGIQYDLTERKKLEYELAQAKITADRARLAERKFLAHMSHEIRTPINAVIGLSHLLDTSLPDGLQQEYLKSLRFSANTLLGLIDNILDLSKIDAGEISFEQKPFDLVTLLKSLLTSIQFKLGQQTIQIFEELDPGLNTQVLGDATRINQIFSNLLENAAKFTEKGYIRLTTRVLKHTPEAYELEFRVEDTGMGIPANKHKTVFEYFKQADTQIKHKFGGTGLGLTIVKQLVEMQGGTIRVESAPGLGTVFILHMQFADTGIPLAKPNSSLEKAVRKNKERIGGVHFLIVEDNLINQTLICKTVENWGCSFEVANNGLEALSKTAKKRFDVILMDINMPEIDGCTTTLAIRKDDYNPNQHVPILALTAAAMSDDKRRAFEAGMNDFLTKPISPDQLQERILHALEETPPTAASSLTDTPPLFNLHYLLEMSGGDQDFVREIIQTFWAQMPPLLAQIQQSAQQQDWDNCGKIAHQIKPSLHLMGLQKAGLLARQIEQMGKEELINSIEISQYIAQLCTDVARVLPALRDWLGPKSPRM